MAEVPGVTVYAGTEAELLEDEAHELIYVLDAGIEAIELGVLGLVLYAGMEMTGLEASINVLEAALYAGTETMELDGVAGTLGVALYAGAEDRALVATL